MNIAQIEDAAKRGTPFILRTADGAVFEVPHSDYISFPPSQLKRRTYVVVYNDQDYASILPLITITSLTQKAETAGSS